MPSQVRGEQRLGQWIRIHRGQRDPKSSFGRWGKSLTGKSWTKNGRRTGDVCTVLLQRRTDKWGRGWRESKNQTYFILKTKISGKIY